MNGEADLVMLHSTRGRFAQMPVWRHLISVFVAQRSSGLRIAAKRLAAASRVLMFHRHHLRLCDLSVYQRYLAKGDVDPLIHFSRRHYLAIGLTLRQRADCALLHFSFESERYQVTYHDAVYDGRGVVLWANFANDTHYTIRLEASNTDDRRCEGALSVVLYAGSTRLNETSFSWVEAAVLGSGVGTIPFITRSQSAGKSSAELKTFRKAFPHNSPSYFCLAAVHGIAGSHSMEGIAGVSHDHQVSFQKRYARAFRSSYSELWRSFGAMELGRRAFLMTVPLAPPPMDMVKSNHRGRALARRRHWSDVSESTANAMAQYLAAGV